MFSISNLCSSYSYADIYVANPFSKPNCFKLEQFLTTAQGADALIKSYDGKARIVNTTGNAPKQPQIYVEIPGKTSDEPSVVNVMDSSLESCNKWINDVQLKMPKVSNHAPAENRRNEASPPQWCLPYVAKGKLVQTKIKEAAYNKQFTISVLKLEKPIVILAGVCDGEYLSSQSNVKEIQIKEFDNVMSKYIGKTIEVSGELSNPSVLTDALDVIMYPPVEIQVVK
jgi:hypothetical protein